MKTVNHKEPTNWWDLAKPDVVYPKSNFRSSGLLVGMV